MIVDDSKALQLPDSQECKSKQISKRNSKSRNFSGDYQGSSMISQNVKNIVMNIKMSGTEEQDESMRSNNYEMSEVEKEVFDEKHLQKKRKYISPIQKPKQMSINIKKCINVTPYSNEGENIESNRFHKMVTNQPENHNNSRNH